jgi:biopolymer transport protein ExbB
MRGVEWVFEQGGWVSYALAIVSLLLWSAVTIRALNLRGLRSLSLDQNPQGSHTLARFLRSARTLRKEPGRMDQLAERTLHQLGTMRSLIRTLVAVAPLLGLLGTVIGMVEMFGSMQGAASLGGESTVAGGISTALVTTQLGLVISAPGLVAAYWLTRQQLRRERDVQDVLRALQGASA